MAAQHDPTWEHHSGLTHRDGLKAHVVIGLSDGVDAFKAFEAIKEMKAPAKAKGLTRGDVHFGLGEHDMIVDLHAKWTRPPGDETRNLGLWVNAVRQLTDDGGRTYVRRTSTIVCMNT